MVDKEAQEKIAEGFISDDAMNGLSFLTDQDRTPTWLELDRFIKALAYRKLPKDKPPIVCLCGSTRFVDTFNEWRKKLTLENKIVVSIELVLSQSEREDPQHNNYSVKQALDELHLRKIDIADEVMILNVGGYIGESTAREIKYAQSLGKPIKYLEYSPSPMGYME